MIEGKGTAKRKYVWLAVLAVAALLLVPFPTQLSPDFTIRFVDDAGNPIRGMEVQRSCMHYTYDSIGSVCPEDWDNPKRTDNDGNIDFAATYVWYGGASRVVRTVFSHILLIAHGSVGKRVTLFPDEPEGFKRNGWINIDPDNPQREAVLQRENKFNE